MPAHGPPKAHPGVDRSSSSSIRTLRSAVSRSDASKQGQPQGRSIKMIAFKDRRQDASSCVLAATNRATQQKLTPQLSTLTPLFRFFDTRNRFQLPDADMPLCWAPLTSMDSPGCGAGGAVDASAWLRDVTCFGDKLISTHATPWREQQQKNSNPRVTPFPRNKL
jgi:hypothetical protein